MTKLTDLGYNKVSMEITSTCNFRCVYCPYSAEDIRHRQLSKQQAFAVIDELSECMDSRFEFVELNVLGEPLLHPDLFLIIKYAHEKNIKVKLITNGSILTGGNVQNIFGCRPAFLKVSVESLNKKCFNVLRGTRMSFDVYLGNIIGLVKKRLDLGDSISTIVQIDFLYIPRYYLRKAIGSMGNEKFLKYINHTFKQLYADGALFFSELEKACGNAIFDKRKFLSNFHEVKKNNFADTMPLYEISKFVTLNLKRYCTWVNLRRKYPLLPAERIPCFTDKLGILGDGRVVLCCSDYYGGTELGNIFDMKLGDILAGSQGKIRGLRRGILPFSICRKCLGYSSRKHRFLRRLKSLIYPDKNVLR